MAAPAWHIDSRADRGRHGAQSRPLQLSTKRILPVLRRMADTAAFFVDRVIPHVPVRQWVLSLPIALRYKLAYDSTLAAEVLQIFVRRAFSSLRHRARRKYGPARYDYGRTTGRRKGLWEFLPAPS